MLSPRKGQNAERQGHRTKVFDMGKGKEKAKSGGDRSSLATG